MQSPVSMFECPSGRRWILNCSWSFGFAVCMWVIGYLAWQPVDSLWDNEPGCMCVCVTGWMQTCSVKLFEWTKKTNSGRLQFPIWIFSVLSATNSSMLLFRHSTQGCSEQWKHIVDNKESTNPWRISRKRWWCWCFKHISNSRVSWKWFCPHSDSILLYLHRVCSKDWQDWR